MHLSCGISALVVAAVLGKRRGFPGSLQPPHSPGMVMTGAAMLWVGWFGFNAGSALAADGSAGMAMTVTHIAAATGALTWMFAEWAQHGKPTLVGIATGAIAGLATITPASGYVGPVGALIIGISAGLLCYMVVPLIKQRLEIDDSLDVFAVHGVGGATGIVLTSFLAASVLGGGGFAEGFSAGKHLWVQLVGVAATAAWAGGMSYVIIKAIGAISGLRVPEEEETEGLDINTHGERGYEF